MDQSTFSHPITASTEATSVYITEDYLNNLEVGPTEKSNTLSPTSLPTTAKISSLNNEKLSKVSIIVEHINCIFSSKFLRQSGDCVHGNNSNVKKVIILTIFLLLLNVCRWFYVKQLI